MNEKQIKLGPMALVLTVISVCLMVLSVLSMSTAAADRRLAEKYAQTVQTRYSLTSEAERALAEFSAASAGTSKGEGDLESLDSEAELPTGFTENEDGSLIAVFEKDRFKLTVKLVKTEDGAWRIDTYRMKREWSEDAEINYYKQ